METALNSSLAREKLWSVAEHVLFPTDRCRRTQAWLVHKQKCFWCLKYYNICLMCPRRHVHLLICLGSFHCNCYRNVCVVVSLTFKMSNYVRLTLQNPAAVICLAFDQWCMYWNALGPDVKTTVTAAWTTTVQLAHGSSLNLVLQSVTHMYKCHSTNVFHRLSQIYVKIN